MNLIRPKCSIAGRIEDFTKTLAGYFVDKLTADAFRLVSCQAAIFTPEGDPSAAQVMQNVYPQVATFFDGEPVVLPPFPAGAPDVVPRLTLQSKSGEWRCDVSRARVDVRWRRPKHADEPIQLSAFFERAMEVLLTYHQKTGEPRIDRLAGITTRMAECDNPGLFLARHFCKEQWKAAPLNRPENFELHAHKKFRMGDSFDVNSWARSKTGSFETSAKVQPIVVFEQDLNTPPGQPGDRKVEEEELRKFFKVVVVELDKILGLYYPS